MDYREVHPRRAFLLKLAAGGDWRGQIEAFAAEAAVDAGWFVGLGAVRDAELWFYDQQAGEYRPFTVDRSMEMASCMGNIARLDGSPFAHTHAVLSDPDGHTLAGHLEAGEVFAGELYVQAFEAPLERAHDPATDLDAWDL